MRKNAKRTICTYFWEHKGPVIYYVRGGVEGCRGVRKFWAPKVPEGGGLEIWENFPKMTCFLEKVVVGT